MKETLKHLEFWLKKRNELPVKGDPNADWLQMQAALNDRMPSSGNIKKPYNPKAIKWLYKLLIGFSAVITVYKGGQLLLSKTTHAPVIQISEKNFRVPPVVNPVSPVKPDLAPGPGNSKLSPQGKGIKDSAMAIPLVIKVAAPTLPGDTSLLKKDVKTDGASNRNTDILEIREKSIKDALDSSSLSIKPGLIKPIYDSFAIHKSILPGKLSNKASQNALSDSLRKAKKRRRKIGVFL